MRKAFLLLLLPLFAASQNITCTFPATAVGEYDYAEAVIALKKVSKIANPFTDVYVKGKFWQTGSTDTALVEGFCDDATGKIFRLRFMPRKQGAYQYQVQVRTPGQSKEFSGKLTCVPSNHKGLLRVDKLHPQHFVHEKTGEHFFWNSTTCYWMLGWREETVIAKNLERLAKLGINRIRVAINGRAHGGSRWNEPTVVECPQFTFCLDPWVAAHPGDLDNPGFDTGRMNLAHWQKLDRLMLKARELGIVVSLIFYVDGLDHACDPFKKENMGGEHERLYYAYAAARYAAFENLMWDIANEYHLFRTEDWANQMGPFLKAKDPYQHLISVHGHGDFPFRKSTWVDAVMFQSWDECGGHDFMAKARQEQAAIGRILPVVNEEYGYEGHYPPWGCGATAAKERPDGRSGLNRSRLAWEICMAGGYQTTGETAEFGTGAGEDTGGGWINGRGNDQMTMLRYYHILKDCFEKTQYWLLEPHNELVSNGNFCLARLGQEYLIYTRSQHCRLQLPPNQHYSVLMIDPLTGQEFPQPNADSQVDNNAWQYRKDLTGNWVFVLKRKA